MLTLATLGMAGYGLYAIISALADLLGAGQLEIWANIAAVLFGGILIVGAAFVRVLMPGGLALAIGAILSLQALAIHAAAHLYGRVEPVPQVALGAFVAVLVGLAYAGSRVPPARGHQPGGSGGSA